jgi:hypothetical protein
MHADKLLQIDMILILIHLTADVTFSTFQKNGWQTMWKGSKQSMAGLFHHACHCKNFLQVLS